VRIRHPYGVLDLPGSGRRWDACDVQASDAELIRSAAQGEAAARGAVLHRHRPALLATAVALAGRDDAEDVVHDAFLVAVRRVGELRDPAAAGAWLRAIVRTEALTRLRRRRDRPTPDLEVLAGATADPGPEEAIEALALRDWVWSALERLSEPLRVVALLRFFATRCSYEEIAAILDLPVGTVRSRLNQVKLKLADALLIEAARAHHDLAAREQAAERYHRDCVDAVNHGDLSGYAERWASDVAGHPVGAPTIQGRARIARMIADNTPRAGVSVLLDRVIASEEITVLEARLANPPGAPAHCPAATTQIHWHPGGRTRSILFAFSDAHGGPVGIKDAPSASRPLPGTWLTSRRIPSGSRNDSEQ
jgi:RNA polymerase sigma-70 factor (ECF subfamily)